MIRINESSGRLHVLDQDNVLTGKQRTHLLAIGFRFNREKCLYYSEGKNVLVLFDKVTFSLNTWGFDYEASAELISQIEKHSKSIENLQRAKQQGASLKKGETNLQDHQDFLIFLNTNLYRKLKDHQIKSAIHLLEVINGANFSVPGSGKTTVVLSVYLWLKHLDLIDALFVVGPPSCFAPWQKEYFEVTKKSPKVKIFAGGNALERQNQYRLFGDDDLADLYLTTFQTLQRDTDSVVRMFKEKEKRFFLVVDEAHYIKQIDGAWANAVLTIAIDAERRCILSGTPFPRSYTDSFNLFDVLWPDTPPIGASEKLTIQDLSKNGLDGDAISVMQQSIDPLFYRVRKKDLHLSVQNFHKPILVKMNEYEKLLYDATLDRLRSLSSKDYYTNIDILLKLKRGRMMRLRQCVSYAKLLATIIPDYGEEIFDGDVQLADIIRNYDSFETPAKIQELVRLVKDLRSKNEKILIWSNFVQTLHKIQESLVTSGYNARIIYGQTPTESSSVDEEYTREKIISEFISESSGMDILIANPAACAESISLHKTCAHAIYYDLSYNCAQYLQSLDRIHRVGGSEIKIANYYFLQYEDTVDQDIMDNLLRKAEIMSHIIDQDYPIYSLDMFEENQEGAVYDKLFIK